uniref:Uncharacterized protein n=1 Tax=Rangifer tarandus platyrhynchus TaxID=3082113 RepID=A0ACB0E7Q3_RANTA|nr:unnamed protein product [Rangifer tarandus platyrhynchus]
MRAALQGDALPGDQPVLRRHTCPAGGQRPWRGRKGIAARSSVSLSRPVAGGVGHSDVVWPQLRERQRFWDGVREVPLVPAAQNQTLSPACLILRVAGAQCGWLQTLLPNVLLSATHCTEEGRKSMPPGADLVMDVGKALSLDFGREVLFVRNLQQSGLEVIREGCLKDAELEAEGEQDVHWKREERSKH